MVDQTSKDLLEHFRAGDSQAAEAIFNRYVRRLIDLTRQRISNKLARRVDPEDVVQSAYRSFFVHARDGEFVLERAGDLWRLLAGITLNKLHGQVERHTAGRRSIRQEQDPGQSGPRVSAPEPTPDEVAGLKEQVTATMRELSTIERQALEMRLKGNTIETIASATNRSQRTVRRLLQTAQRRLERQLVGD